MSDPLVIIRPFEESDRRFVEASWFESYLKALRLPELPFEIFKHGMNARIARLIENSDVRIAAARAFPDEILGYAVLDKTTPVMHWLYVKASFRRNGLGTKLLNTKPGTLWYTHKPTREGHRFLVHHSLNFNPTFADPDANVGNDAG